VKWSNVVALFLAKDSQASTAPPRDMSDKLQFIVAHTDANCASNDKLKFIGR
jgi:hypothetical protein